MIKGFYDLDGVEVFATVMNAKDLDLEIECDHCGKLIKGKYVSACDKYNCEGIWGISCFQQKAQKIDLGESAEKFFEQA